jgi:hypothetical protein
MDKFNIAVLVDAKQEYTHQLIQLLYPQIYVGIKSIYDVAKEYCNQSNDNNILKKFQQLLSNVPKWNTDRIDDEFKRIQKNTECDWIEDLITAVFVSHTKVLTAIQLKNNNKKTIQLNVPQGPFFVHKCYTEVARAFWKRPYLFNHQLSNIDLQRNLADAEQVIKDAIHETVRRMLPVRHILKEYLGGDYKDDEINDDDITSHISLNTKNNLRKLVQQEIEQTLSKKDEAFIDNELIKQIDIPTNKKSNISKNEPLNITKVIVEDENKLEQEIIEAITSNNSSSTSSNELSYEPPTQIIDTHIDEPIIQQHNEIKAEILNNDISSKLEIENDKYLVDNIDMTIEKENKSSEQSDLQLLPTQTVDTENNKLGMVDIFNMKYDEPIKQSSVIDVKPVEEQYDIFSFFEDAAPYER